MANENSDLLTAGKIALQLGVSGAIVSKAIRKLNIKADLVKSGCSYYRIDVIKQINASLKSK